jgi:hypothetical protein
VAIAPPRSNVVWEQVDMTWTDDDEPQAGSQAREQAAEADPALDQVSHAAAAPLEGRSSTPSAPLSPPRMHGSVEDPEDPLSCPQNNLCAAGSTADRAGGRCYPPHSPLGPVVDPGAAPLRPPHLCIYRSTEIPDEVVVPDLHSPHAPGLAESPFPARSSILDSSSRVPGHVERFDPASSKPPHSPQIDPVPKDGGLPSAEAGGTALTTGMEVGSISVAGEAAEDNTHEQRAESGGKSKIGYGDAGTVDGDMMMPSLPHKVAEVSRSTPSRSSRDSVLYSPRQRCTPSCCSGTSVEEEGEIRSAPASPQMQSASTLLQQSDIMPKSSKAEPLNGRQLTQILQSALPRQVAAVCSSAGLASDVQTTQQLVKVHSQSRPTKQNSESPPPPPTRLCPGDVPSTQPHSRVPACPQPQDAQRLQLLPTLFSDPFVQVLHLPLPKRLKPTGVRARVIQKLRLSTPWSCIGAPQPPAWDGGAAQAWLHKGAEDCTRPANGVFTSAGVASAGINAMGSGRVSGLTAVAVSLNVGKTGGNLDTCAARGPSTAVISSAFPRPMSGVASDQTLQSGPGAGAAQPVKATQSAPSESLPPGMYPENAVIAAQMWQHARNSTLPAVHHGHSPAVLSGRQPQPTPSKAFPARGGQPVDKPIDNSVHTASLKCLQYSQTELPQGARSSFSSGMPGGNQSVSTSVPLFSNSTGGFASSAAVKTVLPLPPAEQPHPDVAHLVHAGSAVFAGHGGLHNSAEALPSAQVPQAASEVVHPRAAPAFTPVCPEVDPRAHTPHHRSGSMVVSPRGSPSKQQGRAPLLKTGGPLAPSEGAGLSLVTALPQQQAAITCLRPMQRASAPHPPVCSQSAAPPLMPRAASHPIQSVQSRSVKKLFLPKKREHNQTLSSHKRALTSLADRAKSEQLRKQKLAEHVAAEKESLTRSGALARCA